MLFPVIVSSTLMTWQALLALLHHRRHRPALQRLAHDHREALAHLREGDRRGPFFSPAGFPVPGTTWPGTTAFDDAANPSNGAPHSPPNRLRSSCAAYTLRYDGQPEPPGPTPTAASPAPRSTGNHPPV